MMCTICGEVEASADGKCWNCTELAVSEEKHELWAGLTEMQNKTVLRQRWLDELPDGQPCDHKGCLSHFSHPCDGCGRIGGNRVEGLKYQLNAAAMAAQEMFIGMADVGLELGIMPSSVYLAKNIRKKAREVVADNGRMRTALQQILQSDYETAVSIAHAALVDSDG